MTSQKSIDADREYIKKLKRAKLKPVPVVGVPPDNAQLKSIEGQIETLSENVKRFDNKDLNETQSTLTSILQEIVSRVLPSLVALQSKPDRPSWVFSVERDGNGFIKTITAEPKE